MAAITLPTAHSEDIEDEATADAVERVETATFHLAGWAERAGRGSDARADLAGQLRHLAALLIESAAELEA